MNKKKASTAKDFSPRPYAEDANKKTAKVFNRSLTQDACVNYVSSWTYVPSIFCSLRRWVCLASREIDGKMSPIDPKTGAGARLQDLINNNGASFDEALDYAKKNGCGVGLALYDEGAIIEVVLDHVLDGNGRLIDRYRWILDVTDSYTEVSASGDGLRVFLYGPLGNMGQCVGFPAYDLPGGGSIEVRDSFQIVTVTGHPYTDKVGKTYTTVRDGYWPILNIYDRLSMSFPWPAILPASMPLVWAADNAAPKETFTSKREDANNFFTDLDPHKRGNDE